MDQKIKTIYPTDSKFIKTTGIPDNFIMVADGIGGIKWINLAEYIKDILRDK